MVGTNPAIVTREREPHAAQFACSYYFYGTDADKARCVRDVTAVAVTKIKQPALSAGYKVDQCPLRLL